MNRIGSFLLVARVFYELIRYDFVTFVCGFQGINRILANQSGTVGRDPSEVCPRICSAVSVATCFYFKPVLCLERSAVTVTLLRKHGVKARLVIGYQQEPFFCHAWAEVEQRVVNDSQVYKERLLPLYIA